MTSPAVLAAYTFAGLWLVLKYRMLLRGRPEPIVLVDLTQAAATAAAIAVVPSVPISDEAWCADVSFDRVSAAVLLIGAIAPVFDEQVVWPGVGVLSALITAMFLARAQCYGVASLLAGVAVMAAMLRAARWLALK